MMGGQFYKITALVIGEAKPLTGIRQFDTESYDDVYGIIKDGLLKQYAQSQIIKIDVWWMSPDCDEVKEYLKNKQATPAERNQRLVKGAGRRFSV